MCVILNRLRAQLWYSVMQEPSVADSMLNWFMASFFFVGISAMSANANDCIHPCQINGNQWLSGTHVHSTLQSPESGRNRLREEEERKEPVLADDLQDSSCQKAVLAMYTMSPALTVFKSS
jgi:hypothetical protein